MEVFDPYIEKVEQILGSCSTKLLASKGEKWPVVERSPYIMERDKAIELGGYPKESINLIMSSSKSSFGEGNGIYLIGDSERINSQTTHVSYGKIVLLKVSDVASEETYAYLKSTEFADICLRFSDVMTRMSSEKFFTNLRISKKAVRNGFSLDKLGRTMLEQFMNIPQVKEVKVFLIVGDSHLYKELLPTAEKVKEITIALNNVLDGMELDCNSCSLSTICSEVEGLRQVHMASKI